MPAPYSDDLRIKAITAVERGEHKMVLLQKAGCLVR